MIRRAGPYKTIASGETEVGSAQPNPLRDLRTAVSSCGHTMKIPLQHSSDHDRCFMCRPELRDVPASEKCPPCVSAAAHKSQGAADSCGKYTRSACRQPLVLVELPSWLCHQDKL